MALPAVVVSMITVTNTAAGIIGVIKRRCGASQAIIELSSKCDEIVVKIRKLLQTLEGSAEVPHDSRGISTALNLRREEFDVVLKGLEEMDRRTKRTNLVDRTEKFILAQGWAKKMEAINNDLVHVRNGIETTVSSWDVGQLVVSKVVEEITAIDVTKKDESGREARRRGERAGSEMSRCETVNYVDQYLTAMVTLTDRDKAALNRYGDLDKLSLPDALYRAWKHCSDFGRKTEYLQLLLRSADLLHLEANSEMGVNRHWGSCGVERNVDLAISHYRIASSRGCFLSTFHLMRHYHFENDRKSVLKYLKTATETTIDFFDWFLRLRFAIKNDYESTQLISPVKYANQYESAFQQSMCYFFGVGVPKSNENALDALPTFDSDYHSIVIDFDRNSIVIPEHNPYDLRGVVDRSAIRNYADFLFESNLFEAWFVFSHWGRFYSKRKWERYALHATSSHCVNANIFLAHHYSSEPYSNQHKMKRHLLIAAEAGHASAQNICHQLFGRECSISKGLRLEEEKRAESTRKKNAGAVGKIMKRTNWQRPRNAVLELRRKPTSRRREATVFDRLGY